MPDSPLIAVDIVALVEDQVNSSPIVVLHDGQHNRLLPIWIGEPEARAIAVALNRMQTPRPLTHSLLLAVIQKMGGKLTQIVVDRLQNHTYFSSLYVQMGPGGIVIDSRPSDSIALALFAKVPIFVTKEIMDIAGQTNPFPGLSLRQEKRTMKEEDLKKLQELLERAREREQKSE